MQTIIDRTCDTERDQQVRSYRCHKSTGAIHGALESHARRDQQAISVRKPETNRSKRAKLGTFPLPDIPEESITFLWHRGDQPNRFHVTFGMCTNGPAISEG